MAVIHINNEIIRLSDLHKRGYIELESRIPAQMASDEMAVHKEFGHLIDPIKTDKDPFAKSLRPDMQATIITAFSPIIAGSFVDGIESIPRMRNRYDCGIPRGVRTNEPPRFIDRIGDPRMNGHDAQQKAAAQKKIFPNGSVHLTKNLISSEIIHKGLFFVCKIVCFSCPAIPKPA